MIRVDTTTMIVIGKRLKIPLPIGCAFPAKFAPFHYLCHNFPQLKKVFYTSHKDAISITAINSWIPSFTGPTFTTD